ncbi:MAG: hypothetical protein ACYTGZ_15375 [Planctomycetota bacterium]|jgi:hypothetical protein
MRLGIALVLALAACSSFRRGYRQAFNKELEGKAAPAIDGGAWVSAGRVGESEFRAAEWRVLAFFLPN